MQIARYDDSDRRGFPTDFPVVGSGTAGAAMPE